MPDKWVLCHYRTPWRRAEMGAMATDRFGYIHSGISDEVSDAGWLLELIAPPEWHRHALCRQHPDLDWFPEPGDPIEAQQKVCQRCPCRSECLQAGLGEGFGIFGGTTVAGRTGLARSRGALVTSRGSAPPCRPARSARYRAQPE